MRLDPEDLALTIEDFEGAEYVASGLIRMGPQHDTIDGNGKTVHRGVHTLAVLAMLDRYRVAQTVTTPRPR